MRLNVAVCLLLFFMASWAKPVQAQSCDCTTDFDFAYKHLKKTPGFRQQFSRRGRKEFDKAAQAIRAGIAQDPLIALHCKPYLDRLVSLVRDGHTHILSTGKRLDAENPEVVATFRKSDAFLQSPRSSLDLDSLRKALMAEDEPVLYGVYENERAGEEILLTYVENGSVQGIVFKTESPFWEPGQVRFIFYTGPGVTNGLLYTQNHQAYGIYPWIRQNNVSIVDMLAKYGYKPINSGPDYTKKRKKGVVYEHYSPGEGIQYLHLASFAGRYPNLRILDSLYAELVPELLDTEHLILDVRDNGGGGQRAYNDLLKPLLKAKSGPQVHVIMNRQTGSAAEHFVLDLQSHGAIVYGQNSAGAINYRYKNRGNSEALLTPCNQYYLQYSVAKNPRRFRNLSRELTGITPDIYLDSEKEWVGQVLEKVLK